MSPSVQKLAYSAAAPYYDDSVRAKWFQLWRNYKKCDFARTKTHFGVYFEVCLVFLSVLPTP